MKRFVLIALALVQGMTGLELMLVLSVAPQVAAHFDVPTSSVAFLNIGYALSGFVAIAFGYLADKYSITRVMCAGVIAMALGCAIAGSDSLFAYVCGRFVFGAGSYALSSIIQSYTAMLVDEKRLGFYSGIYRLVYALALFVAPMLGTFTQDFGGFIMVYRLMALILAILAVVFFYFPAPIHSQVDASSLRFSDLATVFADRKSLLMMGANIGITMPSVLFYTYASIYLNDQGVTPEFNALFYTVVALGSIVAGLAIVVCADKVGKWRMTIAATALAALALGVMLHLPGTLILGAAFLFGLGFDALWGLFYPLCTTFNQHITATFVTFMGALTSGVSLVNNTIAPSLYQSLGFGFLMAWCTLTLALASIAMSFAKRL